MEEVGMDGWVENLRTFRQETIVCVSGELFSLSNILT